MIQESTPRGRGRGRFAYLLIALVVVPPTLALVPTATKPEEVGFSSERLQRVREAVQRHIDARA